MRLLFSPVATGEMGSAGQDEARGGPQVIQRRATGSGPPPSAPEAGASPPLWWGREESFLFSPVATGEMGSAG